MLTPSKDESGLHARVPLLHKNIAIVERLNTAEAKPCVVSGRWKYSCEQLHNAWQGVSPFGGLDFRSGLPFVIANLRERNLAEWAPLLPDTFRAKLNQTHEVSHSFSGVLGGVLDAAAHFLEDFKQDIAQQILQCAQIHGVHPVHHKTRQCKASEGKHNRAECSTKGNGRHEISVADQCVSPRRSWVAISITAYPAFRGEASKNKAVSAALPLSSR